MQASMKRHSKQISTESLMIKFYLKRITDNNLDPSLIALKKKSPIPVNVFCRLCLLTPFSPSRCHANKALRGLFDRKHADWSA